MPPLLVLCYLQIALVSAWVPAIPKQHRGAAAKATMDAPPTVAEAFQNSVSQVSRAVKAAVSETLFETKESVDATINAAKDTLSQYTVPTRDFATAISVGIATGYSVFSEHRKNTTIITTGVIRPTLGATGQQPTYSTSPPSTKRWLLLRAAGTPPSRQPRRLSSEAQRAKDLLLNGPHSPLYKGGDDYGI